MKTGLFVDKGTELMRLSMKWGGFMEREQGAKERRREEGGDWQAKCCAGGKGEGVGLRGKDF